MKIKSQRLRAFNCSAIKSKLFYIFCFHQLKSYCPTSLPTSNQQYLHSSLNIISLINLTLHHSKKLPRSKKEILDPLQPYKTLALIILTSSTGRSPAPTATFEISSTTSIPSTTTPKTGCFDVNGSLS